MAAFGRSLALVDEKNHGYLAPATFTTKLTLPVVLEPQVGNYTRIPVGLTMPRPNSRIMEYRGVTHQTDTFGHYLTHFRVLMCVK